MTLCIASGILICEVALPEPGIIPRGSSFWREMHDTTATVTLILVPIHAALRWQWIGHGPPIRHLASGTATVKFLRHFAAVLLIVAVIVGLGMLWAHASGGGTDIGGGLKRLPSREAAVRLEQIRSGVIRTQSDDGFDLSNTSNLIRTCEIEAVLAVVVITASAIRRRNRRVRRAATAPSAATPNAHASRPQSAG